MGHRILLRLFPPRFRERNGEEWLDFVAHQRGEPRYRGRAGALRYWVDVTWDAARTGLAARLDERRRREGTMRAAVEELGAAARSLGRNAGFTALVVATLAVGIGATTAIFSLANWVILRPVPGVEAPDEVVTVRFQSLDRSGWFLVSHPDWEDLARELPALEASAAIHEAEAHVVLPGSDTPVRRPVELVAGDFRGTLGLRPALGRVPGEGPGSAREVMVSHRLWRETLGGERAALGRTLVVNGRPFTLVGVGPEGFRGASFPHRPADFWFPVTAHGDLTPQYPSDLLSNRRRSFYFTAYARLAEGVTAEALEAQLVTRRDALVELHGDAGSMGHLAPSVRPGLGLMAEQEERLAGTVGILLTVVGFLLVLACANAGNLVLGRGLGRRTELAVRSALGGSRRRIAGMLLTEGLLIGALAGVLGVGLAAAAGSLFAGLHLLWFLPALEPVALDGRVLAFAVALSLVTGVLFSLAPALAVTRTLGGAGRGGRRVAGGSGRLRSGLVVAQVALTLALVVGSGLLLGTVDSLRDVPLGFDPAGVVEGTVDPGTQGYARADVPAFWRDLLESTRGAPGVEAAGLAWAPLHGRVRSDVGVRPEGAGDDAERSVYNNYVTDGFLTAVGLELLAGRDFLPAEIGAEPKADVVIVSRGLADALFPAGDALGRYVTLSWRDGRRFEVVGIVADARLRTARQDDTHLLLEPFGQAWMPSWATLYARAAPGTAGLTGTLRRSLASVDPVLPMYDVQPVARRLDAALSEERVLATATGLFAALALFLSTVGLYGVMAQTVSARRQELGIRMALGASGERVRARVLGLGARTTALGLGAGAVLAWAVGKVVSSRLWGVEPLDPVILGGAVALLAASALVACWVPARRATRADPVAALRSE